MILTLIFKSIKLFIMIQVKNISKSFGDIKAVDNLCFEIQKGEVVGFLGPNGAGKTTTLRLLTGFLFPDQGEIKIKDKLVFEQTIQAQKYIGYLPENNPLYKDMLVSEILNLSADFKNIPKAKKRKSFDFVVSACNISDVFYRPIRELSKGYKQRVGIAAALIDQPLIIIMDEPTEGLDPNQREEIRSLIKFLSKNHTIIMSTHVMQEAQAVCSRLLIINQGKLVADGSPEELSQASQQKRILLLDLEGPGIESALVELAQKNNIELLSDTGPEKSRFKAKIILKNNLELQPQISQLAHQNNWIIWEIKEQEQKLEDVFRKLTS